MRLTPRYTPNITASPVQVMLTCTAMIIPTMMNTNVLAMNEARSQNFSVNSLAFGLKRSFP